MEGIRKYGGKWHSVVPEPEIKVDKEAIRKAFKEAREKHTVRVRQHKLP